MSELNADIRSTENGSSNKLHHHTNPRAPQDRHACHVLRAAPLVLAKVKMKIKNAVFPSLPFAASGVFDSEFGLPSHEWSCSERSELP